MTCIEILKGAFENILNPRFPEVTDLSFGIMVFTMGVNIFVTSYERKRGMALKSDFLIADAKHTMSDLVTSSTVLISLVATKMGFPVVDSLASLFIAVMIGRLGYEIVREASDVLVDASPLIGDDLARVLKVASSVEGVRECHNVRVRGGMTQYMLIVMFWCRPG